MVFQSHCEKIIRKHGQIYSDGGQQTRAMRGDTRLYDHLLREGEWHGSQEIIHHQMLGTERNQVITKIVPYLYSVPLWNTAN
jgi:hypothetical protein